MKRLAMISSALGAAAALASGAGAADCRQGYAYAGVTAPDGVRGISATITSFAQPLVQSGHVAAWVGISTQRNWLQVGMATFPRRGSRLYFEVKLPGRGPQFFDLGPTYNGRPYAMVVSEVEGRPNWWKAAVGGVDVTRAIYLAGTHGLADVAATGESWSTQGGSCNGYAFGFESVRALGAAGWSAIPQQRIADRGYRVTPLAPSAFYASTNG